MVLCALNFVFEVKNGTEYIFDIEMYDDKVLEWSEKIEKTEYKIYIRRKWENNVDHFNSIQISNVFALTAFPMANIVR